MLVLMESGTLRGTGTCMGAWGMLWVQGRLLVFLAVEG